MSIRSAKAYVERLASDPGFARSIKDAKDAESRMKILSSAGFDFAKSELDSVVSALPKDQLAGISLVLTDLTSMQITQYS